MPYIKGYCSIRDVAKSLKVTQVRVWQKIKSGEIKGAIQFSRIWMVPEKYANDKNWDRKKVKSKKWLFWKGTKSVALTS